MMLRLLERSKDKDTRLAALATAALLLAWPAAGRAQVSYAGAWQAGATSMDVAVQSWGKDCGPRPTSTQSAGGGNVRIDSQGQALVIRSGGRDVRTDQCWSPNPAMRRQGSTYVNGVWTTRCKTAATDPREESGVYSVKALTDDRLLYQDVSQFNWKLKDSACNATITTVQVLHRLKAGTSTRTATPTAAATAPPCVPGPAKRLLLRPRSAEIELGARACFEPRVLDAAGCPLKDPAIHWSLRHGKAIKAKMEGNCLVAGSSSAESEGTFTVVAALDGLRAEAEVAVSAASLLPSLLAKRMEAGAITGTEALPAAPEATAAPETETPTARTTPPPTTRVSARALSQSHDAQRWRWLAAAFAVLALAGAALALLRRSNPRLRDSRGSQPVARAQRCPKCGTVYPEGHTFCGEDGSALVPTQ